MPKTIVESDAPTIQVQKMTKEVGKKSVHPTYRDLRKVFHITPLMKSKSKKEVKLIEEWLILKQSAADFEELDKKMKEKYAGVKLAEIGPYVIEGMESQVSRKPQKGIIYNFWKLQIRRTQ